MKHIPWFRMYHEARNDPKLDMLDDAQFRVWHRLLCFASEQEERGVIPYRSLKLLAIQVSKGDVALLESTLAILEELEIIGYEENEIAFTNWIKRQYDKPSDAPEATRTRQSRKRERDKNDVTPQSRDVTPQSRTIEEEEDRRKENKREEEEKKSRAPQSVTETSSSSSSADVAKATQKAANLYSNAMEVLVAEYVPKLMPLGIDIVFEASQWRADYPQGQLKNFRNWLNMAIKIAEEQKAQGASIAPSIPRKPEVEYDREELDRKYAELAQEMANRTSANGAHVQT